MAAEPLLAVRDLRTYFHTDAGVVRAVDGVSFEIHPGEVFAIVGESGSGKSVAAMTIMGLIPQPPGNVKSGEILWKDRNLLRLPDEELRKVRGSEIAMIFQDPMTSLNPVFTVGQQIMEMIRIHNDVSKQEAKTRAIELLELVGIPRPERRVDQYPHEFSGGMRQRAMIAMAIACDPDLLIADEPTTALDVTIQAQVLEVLKSIQAATRSAIMLITHDLGVVAGLADRVMVMYAGRPVETGTVDEVFYDPRHPYTLGLLGSLPRMDESGTMRLHPIPGTPPNPIRVPPGCPFHPRCEFRRVPDPCATEVPPLRPQASMGHRAACHFAEEVGRLSPEEYRRKPAGAV
jgi:oligopeptide/dipeptide ABC transporter ATP-binding protein